MTQRNEKYLIYCVFCTVGSIVILVGKYCNISQPLDWSNVIQLAQPSNRVWPCTQSSLTCRRYRTHTYTIAKTILKGLVKYMFWPLANFTTTPTSSGINSSPFFNVTLLRERARWYSKSLSII